MAAVRRFYWRGARLELIGRLLPPGCGSGDEEKRKSMKVI